MNNRMGSCVCGNTALPEVEKDAHAGEVEHMSKDRWDRTNSLPHLFGLGNEKCPNTIWILKKKSTEKTLWID